MAALHKYAYSFSEFCKTTTIHGFYYINQTKNINKLSWGLLWLAMFGLVARSCANSILQYYQFEINTAMTYKEETEVDFPAITFCPQSGVSKSKLNSSNHAFLFAYLVAFIKKAEDISNRYLEVK